MSRPNQDPVRPPAMLVLAMWRAQAGALMLLGRASGPIPRTGTARVVATSSARGVFRAEFWQLDDSPDHVFLAAVRLPDRVDPTQGARIALRGARAGDAEVELALPGSVAGPEFGERVAELVRGNEAAVTRFMLDVMRPQDGSDMRRPNTVLTSFLARAAQPDGFVEIMASVPDGCVLLQGWGRLPADPVQALLVGSALSSFPAQLGEFDRADVPAPATGNVLVLPPEAASSLRSLQTVYLLYAEELRSRPLVEHRLLDPVASIGHIQHMLPLLSCPAPTQALLRETLQPRYDGRDTLSGSARPVRGAVDLAASAEGAGVYLSGWMFDPGRQVAELHLCGHGFAARLDETWVRVPREDVSDAFRNDAAFPRPQSHEAGFAASTVTGPGPGKPAYLQFTFTDGERAFLPLEMAALADPAIRDRVVASVDLYKPSGLPIIEQHVAPLMARLRPAANAPSELATTGPLQRAQAIVVPLAAPVLPRAFLAGFLLDPLTDDEQLVFVCGPEWDRPGLDTLRELVRFYNLPASILTTSRAPSPGVAFYEAAQATTASEFLLASPTVAGSTAGWRQMLRRAGEGSDVACPTLLYEDWSIRYAGSAELRFSETAPYTDIHVPLAGLSARMAEVEPRKPVDVGTLTCCLLRRSALPAFARANAYSTDAGQEAAFFLRSRELGLSRVWVPAVQVYAPESGGASPSRAGHLVDGWMLRQAWQGEQ